MSKEKQIEEMAKCCPYYDNGKCHPTNNETVDCDLMCNMFGFMANLENAGYRKQNEGEWIGRRYNFDDDFPILEKSHYLKCNRCGHFHALYTYNPFTDKIRLVKVFDDEVKIPNFCPNCGASMKGGAE